MLLDCADVTVVGHPSAVEIISEVSLKVRRGQILGLVGESGSGKTTLGLALLAHQKRATTISAGEITVGEHQLLGRDERTVRQLRGRAVAYIPQSPASALNPALRLRTQLQEALGSAGADGRLPEGTTIETRVREVLREVALPDDDVFLNRYPHQLSGGQQQRVAIAMAFIGYPELIVLDEPTTGLDVTTQAHVLDTIRAMTGEYGVSGVYISHDMAVVSQLSDEIAVMYRGELVEQGPARSLLRDPQHAYTRRLLAAVPRLHTDGAPDPYLDGGTVPARSRSVTDSAEHDADSMPLLRVRDLAARYGRTTVLHDINLDVHRGECVALLGESGSGKTTLSRAVVGLHRQFSGQLQLDGQPLATSSYRRDCTQRRRVQYIFQNPYEALNPRQRVSELILRPLRHLCGRVEDPERVVAASLEQVSLPARYASRFPDQLSGGERQRVSIARAIATQPDLLICDEITSALDVSVQAAIVDVLRSLQQEGLALLFVTHNIALVSNVAQRVAVLNTGEIVEHGPVAEVLAQPSHPYTRALIADAPSFEAA
ncbi:ABC transporter ATP-binding protein [Lipingzhangella sp. LS1_29]|uniref:ABC transporter ATP-binding protein n=1 Tax=Lipingzhangella rawalii TaxID=2055835 RepID=A0ABU2H1J2_9ACTN|nr:ABC transporter ATP-binding protein [Lipingzhangella rawalii]MDS1269187.1 ABC transporter ATP-binding protein [Lipingzhangella rawalii]